MRVLLLGAGGSAGWNFAKAVETEHEVIGADVDAQMLALSACHSNVLLKTAISEPLGRLVEIRNLVDRHKIDFIHAQPDPEVQWLGRYRERINALTLLPHNSSIYQCANKLLTAGLLGRKIPGSVPWSHAASEQALLALGGRGWLRTSVGAGAMGALPVDDWATAQKWIAHWHRKRGIEPSRWMLAEELTGRNLSWTGIYKGGTLVASACKERDVLMGASRSAANVSSTATVQRIVERPDVNELCERAVPAIELLANGIWMVDLREDENGRPKITEINCGRFGTTSLFWAEAGGNLPLIYLEARMSRRDVCTNGATWVRQPDMGARLIEA